MMTFEGGKQQQLYFGRKVFLNKVEYFNLTGFFSPLLIESHCVLFFFFFFNEVMFLCLSTRLQPCGICPTAALPYWFAICMEKVRKKGLVREVCVSIYLFILNLFAFPIGNNVNVGGKNHFQGQTVAIIQNRQTF